MEVRISIWSNIKNYFGVGRPGFGQFGSWVRQEAQPVKKAVQRISIGPMNFIKRYPTPASFVNQRVIQPRIIPAVQRTMAKLAPPPQIKPFVNVASQVLGMKPKIGLIKGLLEPQADYRTLKAYEKQTQDKPWAKISIIEQGKTPEQKAKLAGATFNVGLSAMGGLEAKGARFARVLRNAFEKGVSKKTLQQIGKMTEQQLAPHIEQAKPVIMKYLASLRDQQKIKDVITSVYKIPEKAANILSNKLTRVKNPNKVSQAIDLVKAEMPKVIKPGEVGGVKPIVKPTTIVSKAGEGVKYTEAQANKEFGQLGTIGGKKKPKPDILKAWSTKERVAEISQDEARAMTSDALYKTTTKEYARKSNDILNRWIGAKQAAGTTGAEMTAKYNVPWSKVKETIRQLESSKGKNQYTKAIRDAYNIAFEEAKALTKQTGQKIEYLQNYLTHIWKESPAQIEAKFRGAGRTFSFANERTIPTYEEGIKLGLTPRYENPAQMLGEYYNKLGQTKANLNFINELKNEGLVVPASIGAHTQGFMPIEALGFPKNTTSFNGQTVIGNWYAPVELAQKINKLMSPQEGSKILKATGWASGKIQDIVLSGGTPYAPNNAFVFAQGLKETLAGRGLPFIKSWVQATIPGTATKTFKMNAGLIKEMQSAGIPFRSSFTIDQVADQGIFRNWFGKKGGQIWNKAVNDATFQRFMPLLQLNFYRDVKTTLIKKGVSEAIAITKASEATKNFYGLTQVGKDAMKSENYKNLLKTVTFAPKYRASMINFWTNNLKSMAHPFSPENIANTRFNIGALLTFAGYEVANYALNGKWMHENPSGTEDKLLIPLDNGQTIGIPFLSSIATIPRMAGRIALKTFKGDIKGAGMELRSATSMLIKPFLDIGANEDYYGRAIYNESDDTKTKYKKMVGYFLKANQHPWIRAAIEAKQGINQSGYETISTALEAPIRFYKTESLNNRYFFTERDKILKKLNPADRKIFNRWYIKAEGEESAGTWEKIAKAADLLAHPDVLKAQTRIQINSAIKTGKSLDPFYSLPPAQQQEVLLYQTLAPGAKEKSQIIQRSPWLPDFWDIRDKFFSGLPNNKTTQTATFPISPQVKSKQDYYFTLPLGTGQRTAFLKANPDLTNYWDGKRAFVNGQRAELGLPPLEATTYAKSSTYKKYAKKAKKLKTIKIKVVKAKTPKLKVAKLSKLKGKSVKYKVSKLTTKKPKIKIRKPNG